MIFQTTGRNDPPDDRSSNEILEPLLALTREILASENYAIALTRIGQTILDSFGFSMASIVAAEEAGGELRRVALLGFSEEIARNRIGEKVNRDEVESVLRADPEFEVLENCFYIPMECGVKYRAAVENTTADRGAIRPTPERWHPRDALTIVLADPTGAILAYVTVDNPHDGKVPSLQRMRELQLFANLAGLSLANARAIREQKARIKAQSEALEATQKLLLEARNATTDPLTGIANRRAFDETLQSEWKRASRSTTPLTLIFIDVDYFKPYNDRYGHVAGDACLREITSAICDNAKRPDDLVARYGGEEFAVILPSTDLDAAVAIAQDICVAVYKKRIPHADSRHAYVSVSAGVASRGVDVERPAALIEAADAALYRAKNHGRNQALH